MPAGISLHDINKGAPTRITWCYTVLDWQEAFSSCLLCPLGNTMKIFVVINSGDLRGKPSLARSSHLESCIDTFDTAIVRLGRADRI